MLAQLLGKHGLKAKRLAGDRSSRPAIAMLDPGEIAIVCISALETNGSIGRLRLLVRRLRRRLPDTQILIGLWPRDDEAASTEDVVAEVGADRCVVSLGQAVRVCQDAARSATDSPANETAPADMRDAARTPLPAKTAAVGAR